MTTVCLCIRCGKWFQREKGDESDLCHGCEGFYDWQAEIWAQNHQETCEKCNERMVDHD